MLCSPLLVEVRKFLGKIMHFLDIVVKVCDFSTLCGHELLTILYTTFQNSKHSRPHLGTFLSVLKEK